MFVYFFSKISYTNIYFINLHGFLYSQVLTISCDISGKSTVVTWLKHKHIGFFRKVWMIWLLRAIWVVCSFQGTVVSSKIFSKIFLMARKVKKKQQQRLFALVRPFALLSPWDISRKWSYCRHICDTRFWRVRNLAKSRLKNKVFTYYFTLCEQKCFAVTLSCSI